MNVRIEEEVRESGFETSEYKIRFAILLLWRGWKNSEGDIGNGISDTQKLSIFISSGHWASALSCLLGVLSLSKLPPLDHAAMPGCIAGENPGALEQHEYSDWRPYAW
jgi:hypothetical protein